MSEALEKFTPKEIIRTETALSRFPVHRLSKKGSISIAIKVAKPNGELRTQWKVSYNSEYGQPSPLAYKLDTLIISRRIEEEGKPLPKLIRLGSLTEIAQLTGTGEKNTNAVKRALLQNAFAAITAKFTYKTKGGGEAFAEIADTRYGVIFTGEKLPGGEKADAVYIVLHDIYREILNNAVDRPLDYEYMRGLTPGAQRFYELLSFQIYAAIKHGRPRARLLYSEYCTYAPQVRYFDYEHVKKQMYKVHAPHRKSGYISEVELREIKDREGNPDWEMLYTPGRRAKAEYQAFSRPRKTFANRPSGGLQLEASAQVLGEVIFPAEDDPLVEKLVGFGVAHSKAKELVESHRESAEAQIAAYPYRDSGKPKKNAAGWLVAAIEGNYTLPVAYLEEQEKRRRDQNAMGPKAAASGCSLCDQNGWRRVRTTSYPAGAMKRCSHDLVVESKYPEA